MTYQVDLDKVQHAWVANVEATSTEPPRVLLRNEAGNLEHCLKAIHDSISRHALNPWGEGTPRPGGERGTPPVGFGRHQ